ncbi:hypothetical protein ACFWAT_10180 [Streptomyces syringium]|uniref:hypothetical protein n=1 Tax=Streptomyces syringium TaxID=76729 RepID=UPI003654174A
MALRSSEEEWVYFPYYAYNAGVVTESLGFDLVRVVFAKGGATVRRSNLRPATETEQEEVRHAVYRWMEYRQAFSLRKKGR